MKKFAILILLLGSITFFGSATDDNSTITQNSLEGVWELQHQYIYENNEIIDTLYNFNGYRQVKIFSNGGKVMWTRYAPSDSNEWFGYGTYEVKDGILKEQLEYASNAMMEIVDTVQVFRFELEFTKEGYNQTSLDDEGNKYNTEVYKKLE